MEFRYTICYPDRELIDVFEREIDGDKAVGLISSFDWKSELKKPIEFYSPSIDFRRLKDKKRLIFSGLGMKRLTGFQVMFLVPTDSDFTNVFNEKNYLNSTEYSAQVSVKEAKELMKLFALFQDENIIEALRKDEVKAVKKPPKKQKIQTKKLIVTKSKNKYTPFYNTPIVQRLITVLFRILGIMLVLLLLFFAYFFTEGKNSSIIGVVVFIGLAILFFIATIKFEIDFGDND